MSLAPGQPLPVTVVSDPRTSFEEWSVPCRIGGNGVGYLQQQATSLGSLISFDIRPPDWTGSVIGPEMIWYNKVRLTCNTGAGGAGNLLQPGVADAPRAYPFTSIVDNAKMTINGQSFDLQQNSAIGHVLRRFNPRVNLYRSANFCPWMPDSGFCSYSDVQSTNRNPLGSAAVGDFDFTRGAYQRVVYTPDGTNPTYKGTVTLETWEPVNISPLIFDYNSQGIPYVNNMHFDFNISNYARLLSHAVIGTNVAISNAQCQLDPTFNQISTMYYQIIKYPLLGREIAPIVQVPFYNLNVVQAPPAAIPNGVPAAGATVQGGNLQSAMISLGVIPSRIYVFATLQPSTLTMQNPDFTMMYCGNLSLLWGGVVKMQNVLPQQLYTSAVDAGYAFPWENFGGSYLLGNTQVGSSGSVLCLRPGVDFDLPSGQAVGQNSQVNFQVSANFQDQSNTGGTTNVVLWVVSVVPGVATFTSAATCTTQLGVISEADVLEGHDAHVNANDVHDAFGSGIFDTLRKALPFVQKVGRYAHAGLDAAKKNGLLGEGVTSGGSALSGGASMYGGRLLTAKDLRHRLR